MTPRNTVLVGDVRKRLAELVPDSVDCVVTSPPYFGLRNYQVDGQIGLEDSVTAWVDELVSVADGLAEALHPEGTFWLNLGDAYSRHLRFGSPPKSLLLGPERLALALTERGWVLRNKIVWAKRNPQPSSVTDRLSATWESVYLFVRSSQYWFDLDAVRVPHLSRPPRSPTKTDPPTSPPPWAGPLAGTNSGLARLKAAGRPGHRLGKNPGDVWSHATAGSPGAHFAVFPESLIERPILAGCPERVCEACGRGWRRRRSDRNDQGVIEPQCSCDAPWRRGLVLDPFFGSGTVGVVTERLQRDWLGIELNPKFAQLARERIRSMRSRDEANEGVNDADPAVRTEQGRAA
ncbi:MAG: site-specific DNA-methyltransferase [Acidimicrobiales bacterium]